MRKFDPNYTSNVIFFFFDSLFGDSLIVPLQEKIDEWKKSINHFDKENSKGTGSFVNGKDLKANRFFSDGDEQLQD